MLRLAVPWVRMIVATSLVLTVSLVSGSPPSEAGQNTWTKLNLDGRRVQALAVDPVDPNILFAGTNGDGIFRSTNRGQSWVNINSGLGNLFVNDISINPDNRLNILAATGRGGLVGEETAGIYRSTNRGDSWTFQS